MLLTYGKKILRRIFGPICENDLGWTLRRNEEHYDGTDIKGKAIPLQALRAPGG
jgi:hypothetical protein